MLGILRHDWRAQTSMLSQSNDDQGSFYLLIFFMLNVIFFFLFPGTIGHATALVVQNCKWMLSINGC